MDPRKSLVFSWIILQFDTEGSPIVVFIGDDRQKKFWVDCKKRIYG